MKSGWIDVRDKLPREDEDVLILTKRCEIRDGKLKFHLDVGFGHLEDGVFAVNNKIIELTRVVSWMPLPEVPEPES